jgi:hypothetical protein
MTRIEAPAPSSLRKKKKRKKKKKLFHALGGR